MKQARHKRKYKSGRTRIINPHNVKRRSYSMYPLGRDDLKIKWDKDRLQRLYEDEELIKQIGMDFEKSDPYTTPDEKLRKAEERAERFIIVMQRG